MRAMNTPTEFPAVEEVRDRFFRGIQTPSDLTREFLAAIEARDATLHAYASVDAEGALAAAGVADTLYSTYAREAATRDTPSEIGPPLGPKDIPPLAGVPISIKDNIDVAGLVSGCGHAPRSHGAAAADDAPAVARLRRAGAVILGKTHMHEYALGITGRNDALGTPQNPHDPTRLPGGSSSGSAVSVASGLAVASVGSDTGGSIRVPAALCSLVGFKPSFGKIPRGGLFPLSDTMDHVGVLTLRVAGAQRLYHVLAGGPEARPGDAPGTQPPRAIAPTRPRFAALGDLFALADRNVADTLTAARDTLRVHAAEVEDRALPRVLDAPLPYRQILAYEAARVHDAELAANPEAFGTDLRALLEQGHATSNAIYHEALGQRRAFAKEVSALFAEGYDALLAPTTLVIAPPLDAETVVTHRSTGERVTLDVREALLRCTCPFSMIGFPAISLPLPRADDLPVGLQIIGRMDEDEDLLALAGWIEAALDEATSRRVAPS
ncbi:MAG: amidase [Deltaproteobacteria bacterium]|nr:amidase [Deltaproteobacteria bacterium]